MPQLRERIRGWIADAYKAVLFSKDEDTVAYALYREDADEITLRQLFVKHGRRRQGIGRKTVDILRQKVWPSGKRLTVQVLTANEPAVAFWRAVGFHDYCLELEIIPGT